MCDCEECAGCGIQYLDFRADSLAVVADTREDARKKADRFLDKVAKLSKKYGVMFMVDINKYYEEKESNDGNTTKT